ncbi:PP-loop ATpase [Cryptosporidium ryanae]|uniref:PP-loop ATpase n=1 Tax=Cryptosporidium ryanae TaxID=515981 RepID=UPI00351A1D4D|nr:PP-loop ATpase [Cryptosporidium ryanae]
MKVLGLISGGKDSIFNLLCCKQLGFEIAVLANLTPSEDVLEIDSYMYQSVGKELVALISECLEIPLVQKSISGKAINQEIDYKSTEGDEVEDLYNILKAVVDLYPDVRGVSCGAVMSNYQRSRLEEVAYRLNLNSYCFMWMLPEYTLLKSITESNIKSMIVKVASFGLDENYIGRLVSDCLESFKSVQKNVCTDFHCCGEGGEYETITLDGPSTLFKNKCIKVQEYKSVALDQNPYAPVYALKPMKFSLANKEETGDGKNYCLPFIDPESCLEYYLQDTGRYLLIDAGNQQLRETDSDKTTEKIEFEFKSNLLGVSAFETSKTFMLSFSTEFYESKELSDKVKTTLLQNVCNKEWFTGSKAVIFNATLFYSDLSEKINSFNFLDLLSNIWKNINLTVYDVNWIPAIDFGYVNCQGKISNSFFKYNIIINKNSDKNTYRYMHNCSSSSISSYGTAIPKSFSNNILMMKYKDYLPLNSFKIECQQTNVANPSIIVSSCIYGIVPHLQLPPSDKQIIAFSRKNEGLNSDKKISISDSRLSVELSLALRSFRCDLNSVLYNSSLLSFNSEVEFRYDVFNITHMWIVEISETDIPLLSISQYFMSLIEAYKYSERCSSSEWSGIHKFINNSIEHIDPIVVPVVTGEHSDYNSKCKLTPLSLFTSDYKNYYSIKEIENNHIYWSFEARVVNSTDKVLFGVFNVNPNVNISKNNINDIFKELLFIINIIIKNKLNLSLDEASILFSKLFVKREHYDSIISNMKNTKLLYSSTTVPVSHLQNDTPLVYTILLSE